MSYGVIGCSSLAERRCTHLHASCSSAVLESPVNHHVKWQVFQNAQRHRQVWPAACLPTSGKGGYSSSARRRSFKSLEGTGGVRSVRTSASASEAAVAADATVQAPSADVLQLAERLRQGLAYEARQSFCNSRGKEMRFDAFAQENLAELAACCHDNTNHHSPTFQQLADSFASYTAMTSWQRKDLHNRAAAALAGLQWKQAGAQVHLLQLDVAAASSSVSSDVSTNSLGSAGFHTYAVAASAGLPHRLHQDELHPIEYAPVSAAESGAHVPPSSALEPPWVLQQSVEPQWQAAAAGSLSNKPLDLPEAQSEWVEERPLEPAWLSAVLADTNSAQSNGVPELQWVGEQPLTFESQSADPQGPTPGEIQPLWLLEQPLQAEWQPATSENATTTETPPSEPEWGLRQPLVPEWQAGASAAASLTPSSQPEPQWVQQQPLEPDWQTAAAPLAAEETSDDSARTGEEAEFGEGDAASADGAADLAGEEAVPAARKRIVKPETVRFRESFAASAKVAFAKNGKGSVNFGSGEQRTDAWHALRENRLTASAFANALGFFTDGREVLWEEKVGLRAKFAGNAATSWGTKREAPALERYEEVTGHNVEGCRFQVMRDDDVHGWLGASPDGLISSLVVTQGEGTPAAAQPLVQGDGANVISGAGPGVLEVKCPFNRGSPAAARPPPVPQYYYMPQVQGLMEIFDRDWCNMFVWTVNGAGLFHIPRDRAYWAACYQVLADFWWGHVIPAKHATAAGDAAAVQLYRPALSDPRTAQLRADSRDMAAAALITHFPPAAAAQWVAPPAASKSRYRRWK